ncbi:regulatory signaling modulator protein AmpE [Stenotrophomonas tumulicola]|uniref:Regulatory signaling modulator protein AmpE n=1 Tax=Stenotrophomonas tumulicola TaxID=1685415 RepID=A0A7W3FMK4_9GAMM|nr:regulatory signaling modulator protein AmpE [Stenotrophomonas tumulicola]MBA8682329.1 regulatory signaling modulator protein AmpE [Stenotrophomonas tumulicola]
MFTTLVAVLVALALGHVAPDAAATLRRFETFRRWLAWLAAHAGQGWRGAAGVAMAVLPPLLLMAVLAWLLRGVLFGLPSLLLGVAVLAWCWGPRDLDRDVEAIIDADEPAVRHVAVNNLQAAGGSLSEDIPSLVEATVYNALRRWFAVLFWFLLLGPAGALGYRLMALMAISPMRALVQPETLRPAQRVLGWLEWPVAQLMALSMALAGNFDTAWKAWRQAHGERWMHDVGFLGAVARASVSAELREEAHDYTDAGLLPVWQRLPELRDAMSLVWRMLLLWLAALALLVIAGWVT